MAAVALTAAQIAPVFADECEIRSYVAGVAITAGAPLYVNTSGDAALADANGSGTKQFIGIALNTAGIGQAVSVLRRGEVYGFTLTSLAYGALVYVSDTVGTYDDSVGTVTVPVGRVQPLSDPARTKVLLVNTNITADWA
jgi:hypothetical protein